MPANIIYYVKNKNLHRSIMFVGGASDNFAKKKTLSESPSLEVDPFYYQYSKGNHDDSQDDNG